MSSGLMYQPLCMDLLANRAHLSGVINKIHWEVLACSGLVSHKGRWVANFDANISAGLN